MGASSTSLAGLLSISASTIQSQDYGVQGGVKISSYPIFPSPQFTLSSYSGQTQSQPIFSIFNNDFAFNVLTIDNQGGVYAASSIQATTFIGSGANLTSGTIPDTALTSGVSSTGVAGRFVKYGSNGSLSASTGSFTNVISAGTSTFSNITASSSSLPVLNLITTASNRDPGNTFSISNTSGQVSTYFYPGGIGLATTVDFTTNITIDAASGISLQNGPTLGVGNTTLGSGYLRHSSSLSIAIGDNITASGGINLGTSLATTNILGSTVLQGNTFFYQPAASAVNATASLNASTVLLGIITSTTAATVTLTLPTGTNFENAINTYSTAKPVSSAFDFSIINTGTNNLTVASAAGWTLVGSMTISASTSGSFRSRKSAANTFTLYRL